MASSPLRPFVPHRTPKSGRPETSSSEFRLARPYVPGAERQEASRFNVKRRATQPQSARPPTDRGLPTDARTPVPSHANQTMPSCLLILTRDRAAPLEHFLDPLPPVEDFEREGGIRSMTPIPSAIRHRSEGHRAEQPRSGMGQTDWQQYD